MRCAAACCRWLLRGCRQPQWLPFDLWGKRKFWPSDKANQDPRRNGLLLTWVELCMKALWGWRQALPFTNPWQVSTIARWSFKIIFSWFSWSFRYGGSTISEQIYVWGATGSVYNKHAAFAIPFGHAYTSSGIMLSVKLCRPKPCINSSRH